MDHGLVIARGTADELKARIGGERLVVTVDRPDQLELASRTLGTLAGDPQVDAGERQVSVRRHQR